MNQARGPTSDPQGPGCALLQRLHTGHLGSYAEHTLQMSKGTPSASSVATGAGVGICGMPCMVLPGAGEPDELLTFRWVEGELSEGVYSTIRVVGIVQPHLDVCCM